MNVPLAISDTAAIGSAFGAALLGAVVGSLDTSFGYGGMQTTDFIGSYDGAL